MMRHAATLLCLLIVACQCERPSSPPAEPQVAKVDRNPAPVTLESFAPTDTNTEVYLDFAHLGTSAFEPLLQQVQIVPDLAATLAEVEKKCGFRPWQAVEEAAVFATVDSVDGRAEPKGALVVIDAKQDPAALMRCIAGVIDPAGPIESQGYTRFGGIVARVRDSFIVMGGDEPSIARALEGAAKVANSGVRKPRPKASIHATFTGRSAPFPLDANVVIGPADNRALAKASVRFASVEEAIQFETLARQFVGAMAAQASATDPAARDLFQKGFTATRTNDAVALSLDLNGVELAMLGTVSALSIYAVRKYVLNAKTAEARHTLGQIAKGLATWFGNESTARLNSGSTEAVRFPPSTPQVPADVPSGQRFLSGPGAWSHETWRAADFALEEPQHYAYRVLTAPDGRSLVIRASGDLDGDKVISTFEYGMKIVVEDGIEIVKLDEEIRETSPDE